MMSVRRYVEQKLWGRGRGIDSALLRLIAGCLAVVYIVVIESRRLLYRWAVKKRKVLEATVISVGNITLGGAGKTPVVAFLARFLQERGSQVGVLSRGYGRRTRGARIVSDGHTIHLNWLEAGDEPYLLARHLPGVPVLVGARRASTGRLAIDQFGADTLLLDDGFQHVQLHRNSDIVVIDALNPFGNGRVVPAGPLREPLGNLKRATLFWLTRVDQAGDLSLLEETLLAIQPAACIVKSTYRPSGLTSLETDSEIDLSVLRGSKTILLCGIANPLSFRKTVLGVGADVIDTCCFPDHHAFSTSEIQDIQKKAVEMGADAIVTTEKDGVRVPREIQFAVPIYELRIEVDIRHGEECLTRVLWNKRLTHTYPRKS